MEKLIAFELGNGVVLVEGNPGSGISTRRPGDPTQRGVATRGGDDLVEKASRRFEDALEQIRPAAQLIVDKLRTASPEEIEVEFGVKLEAEAGAVITKTSAEAHFKISLKWKK